LRRNPFFWLSPGAFPLSRAQRLLLRAAAGISEGWVNPPPPAAPLPVRRSTS
jgi:hypothetical protein